MLLDADDVALQVVSLFAQQLPGRGRAYAAEPGVYERAARGLFSLASGRSRARELVHAVQRMAVIEEHDEPHALLRRIGDEEQEDTIG